MEACLSDEPGAAGRKRVAFLFAHLHKGGMQKAVSNISCALPAEIEQYVVYFGTEDPGFPYRAEMVDLAVPGGMEKGLITKLANFTRRVRLLQRFIDEQRIDTVVSFGEAANVLNSFVRRKRTILSVRVSIEEALAQSGIYAAVYKGLARRLYKRADLVVPVSQGLAEQLTERFCVPAEKIRVIYNLYPVDRIRELSREPLPDEMAEWLAAPTVINVGSLIHAKGQVHLIRAFAAARRDHPALRLLLVGIGDREPALRAEAASLGVSAAVRFAGFDANPYRYLSRARMFVLPSRFEGFPNVLAEAMICGLPVIATDCKTGPREILGDSEYGILVPDIDAGNEGAVEQQIAAAIVRMMDPACAAHFREKAMERAAEFSQERLIDRWGEIL
jgi:glycosyltransferase involved in cell wall biosynthesis